MISFYRFNFKFPVVIILFCLFQRTLPCVIRFVPQEKYYGRGDYRLKRFESKRSKTLDCTCGTISSANMTELRFPWEATITHASTGKVCRGTIINDRVILTSASCIMKMTLAEILDNPWKGYLFPQQCYAQPNELNVSMAHENENGTLEKVELEVINIYTNPLFLFQRIAYEKNDYDMALLKLKTHINFKNGQSPVCLPYSSKLVQDKHLEGLETLFLTDSQDSSNVTDGHKSLIDQYIQKTFIDHFIHKSFIFPRMRCRMLTENNWISDRFLCTLAPQFTDTHFTDSGGALLVKNGNQYSQIGIHSWRTYFPWLYDLKAVSLASNVFGFLGKIEEYSNKMGAQWCQNDWNGLPKIGPGYKSSEVNDPLSLQTNKSEQKRRWKEISSRFRNVRKSCKCGLVNSHYTHGRIQGGVDAAPYEYGWQVLLIMHFDEGSTKRRQICGGAIINNRIIITAAHCVYNNSSTVLVEAKHLEVYLHRYKGVKYRDDLSRLAPVEAVIPHPHYVSDYVVMNDIALIVLRRPICFKCLQGKVSPLCFPETGEVLALYGRTDARVIGWGRTSAFDPTSHASLLQENWAKIISPHDCIKIFEKNVYELLPQVERDDKKLCAGTLSPSWNYSDPAKGDSGGPLFLPVTVGSNTMIHVGIAAMISLAENINANVTVTLYTRTQSYLDFVDYYSLVVDAVWCSR